MGDELWLARVFCSEKARGCSVAIVLPGAGTPPSLSGLANDLDASVTAFLLPGKEGRWSLLPFARGQRLDGSACALLAAESVLRSHGQSAPVLVFELPCGTGSVRGAELPWARVPTPQPPSLTPPGSPLAWVLGRDAPRAAPGHVVDTGRRVYVQAVRDPATLALLDLPQAQAWAYLRHEGLEAICLYAWAGEGELSVRVFEAGRAGGEAPASDAVVPALWAALAADGPSPRILRVQQGRGAARRRGTFLMRRDAETGDPLVGGDVRLLGRGKLLAHSTSGRRAC